MKNQSFKRTSKYSIEMVGMVSDCVGNITVDNKYALYQIHPTYSLAIIPYISEPHPPFELVLFYSNCLAFEHEIPVSISSNSKKALIEPIIKGGNANQVYSDISCQAYEILKDIRFGLGNIVFRYEAFAENVDIPYSNKYSKVEKELCLYATALRQFDPLSEYLNYYRIIESITGNNGKQWINLNISRLHTYDFGFLEFGDWNMHYSSKRRNLYSIYRKKAISRLHRLDELYSMSRIPAYLYNENRCGIAHGNENARLYDFSYSVKEIAQDNYLLKLLSRIAIEDRIKE